MKNIVIANNEDGKVIVEKVFRKYASVLCEIAKELFKKDVP